MIAVNELCSFLVQRRTQVKDFLNFDGSLKTHLPGAKNIQTENALPDFHFLIDDIMDDHNIDWEQRLRDSASLVDTTLFRAYIFAKPSFVGYLVKLDNFLDPLVVRDKLHEMGRYEELIDFLYQKKHHNEALELLEKFGKNIDNGEDQKEVPSTLRGPRRTVAYLRQLPPELVDIILHYVEWPLRADPGLGMEVFIADTENAETLPRHRVLDFLQNIKQPLAVQYLEHIINELNDFTPGFHQRLVELYLEQLKASSGQPAYIDDAKERAHIQEKLQNFLRSSSQYSKARTFEQMPSDGMHSTKSPHLFHSKALAPNLLTISRSHLPRIARPRPARHGPTQKSLVHLRL